MYKTQDEKNKLQWKYEKRNQYSADFKTQVVLEALREEAAVNEIATKYGIPPVMVNRGSRSF